MNGHLETIYEDTIPLSVNIQNPDNEYYSIPDIEMGGVPPIKPKFVSLNIRNLISPSALGVHNINNRLRIRIPNDNSSFQHV